MACCTAEGDWPPPRTSQTRTGRPPAHGSESAHKPRHRSVTTARTCRFACMILRPFGTLSGSHAQRCAAAGTIPYAQRTMSQGPGITYRDAGVDIDAGDELVERIKPLMRRAQHREVLA